MSRSAEFLNLLEHKPALTSAFALSFSTAVALTGYMASAGAYAAFLRYAPGGSLAPQNNLSDAIGIESSLVGPFGICAIAWFVAGVLSRPLYKLHKQVNV